jgi:hypothetical protein
MGYEAAAAVAARGQLLRGEEKGGARSHGQRVTEKKAAKRCRVLWMIRRVLPLSQS